MTMGKVPVEPQWQLPFSQRKDCVLSTCACTLHHNLRHVCACRCSSYAWVADPLPCSCRRFTPVHRSETKSKTPRPEWQAVTKSSTELCSDQKTRSRDSLNASVCEASDSFVLYILLVANVTVEEIYFRCTCTYTWSCSLELTLVYH